MKKAGELVFKIKKMAEQSEEREMPENDRSKSDAWKEIQTMKLSSTFGRRFVGASIDNYEIYDERQSVIVKKLKGYLAHLNEMVSGGLSLVMAGSSGTGKDHLLAAVGRELIRNDIAIESIKFYELIAGALEAQSNGKSYIRYLEQYVLSPFLIVSEVGIQKCSEFERRILYHIIDERYKEMRPFILTTNLSVDAFKAAIDEDGQVRVWDRLREIARILPFTWESYRGRKA